MLKDGSLFQAAHVATNPRQPTSALEQSPQRYQTQGPPALELPKALFLGYAQQNNANCEREREREGAKKKKVSANQTVDKGPLPSKIWMFLASFIYFLSLGGPGDPWARHLQVPTCGNIQLELIHRC